MASVERTVMQCLEQVGVMGRFQFLLTILFVFQSMLSGYVTFQFQSLAVTPEIYCITPKCDKLKEPSTNMANVICSLDPEDWSFSPSRLNFFSAFNLYCDRMYLISMGTTCYFLGFFLSCSWLCVIVDKLGRKVSTSLFFLMYLLALSMMTVSTTITQILIVRFVLGALHGGISISFYVAYYEFTSAKYATLAMLLSSAGFSIGGGLSGLVAYWSVDWHSTIIPPVIGFTICLVLFQLFVPETPYWLFAKGYEVKAIHSINIVAKYNNNTLLDGKIELISPSGDCTTSKKSQSFSVLYNTPFLRNSLLFLAFSWFTVSICYYGLEFNAGTLGNEYLVMMIMGCFDTPFKLAIYLLAQTIGRQKSCQWYLAACFVCLVFSGIPVLESIPIFGQFTLKTLLVVCGRAFSGSVFALLYIYTSEILPTLVRSVGMSFCSTCARIGSLMAPLVILVNTISPAIIYIFIVVCLAFAMLLLRQIPETLGKPLPNSLQDCENLFAAPCKESKILVKRDEELKIF